MGESGLFFTPYLTIVYKIKSSPSFLSHGMDISILNSPR